MRGIRRLLGPMKWFQGRLSTKTIQLSSYGVAAGAPPAPVPPAAAVGEVAAAIAASVTKPHKLQGQKSIVPTANIVSPVPPLNVVSPGVVGGGTQVANSNESGKPPAKQRNVVPKHCHFKMKNGLGHEFVVGIQAANAHRNDFKGLIEEEQWQSFRHKKDFDNFKKNHSVAEAAASSLVATTLDFGTNNSTIAQTIASQMANDSECDRFHAFWKTTHDSTFVAVAIRVVNQWESDTWVFRPPFLSEILRGFSPFVTKDDQLKEALANFGHAKASDPENPDENIILKQTFTPVSNKTVTMTIFRAHTCISIPHEEIQSSSDEVLWIENTITRVLKGIRDIVASGPFKETLETIAPSCKGDCIKKLFDNNNKTNLPKFLNGCVVRVDPCADLTDHVVEAEKRQIMAFLFKNRIAHAKCIFKENPSRS